MDVFGLRESVVSDYRQYVESFLRIRDDQVADFVEKEFQKGALWPEAILQLNPAYEPGPTLAELADQGVLAPATASFFTRRDGSPLRLYRHQYEAIQIAQRREAYVVTTGTGSGKSLTYLLPIYDHIVRTNPQEANVRALIVYPMNALINSQYEALQRYAERYPNSPVHFDRYTGQEQEEARQRILDNPPHILLTNYVMLEYLLLRPRERILTDRATSNLEFLVLDELHTYRGRQGADVAMLLRRLRERSGNPGLLCVGTSATLVSEGNRDDRRRAAAKTASALFGVQIPPQNIVDETLRRAIQVPAPKTPEALRAATEAPPPPETREGIACDSLAAWVEEAFGLEVEDGRLVRRTPITFGEGVRQLSSQTGLPEEVCAERLKEILTLGNRVRNEDGEPVFAFRLHQFLATGGTVYATVENADTRYLTLEGQRYAPDGDRLLYPLVFCRECGQEYYMVNWTSQAGGQLVPRLPLMGFLNDGEDEANPGYFLLDQEGVWNEDREDELPDHFFDFRGRNKRIKKDYRQHVPVRFHVTVDGRICGEGEGIPGWFQGQPFMVCLRCGAAYDRTQKNEFRKLSRLSQAGRSRHHPGDQYRHCRPAQ